MKASRRRLVAATIISAAFPLLAGCETDTSLGGLMPAQSDELVVADASGSVLADPVAKPTLTSVAERCVHPRQCGEKSTLTVLIGGQGAHWAMDGCGADYRSAREKLLDATSTYSSAPQDSGTDIWAMLERTVDWLNEPHKRATAVLISDFIADPQRDAEGRVVREYRDPATFTWELAHPEMIRLRLYFTSDNQMIRLKKAWAKSLSGVDVRYYRPGHTVGEGDF